MIAVYNLKEFRKSSVETVGYREIIILEYTFQLGVLALVTGPNRVNITEHAREFPYYISRQWLPNLVVCS